MTSLPVPLSPLMNTEASVAATFRASSTALRNRGEIPIRAILSLWPCYIITACEARPMSTWRWVAEKGLGR